MADDALDITVVETDSLIPEPPDVVPLEFHALPSESGPLPPLAPTPIAPTGQADGSIVVFDKDQYLKLIDTITQCRDDLQSGFLNAGPNLHLDGDLGGNVKIGNKEWDPVGKLTTALTDMGGSVETLNNGFSTDWRKDIQNLNKATEIFEETNDLATYEASKFAEEYPALAGAGSYPDTSTDSGGTDTGSGDGTDTDSSDTGSDDGTGTDSSSTDSDDGTGTDSSDTVSDDGTGSDSSDTVSDDGTGTDSSSTDSGGGTGTGSSDTSSSDTGSSGGTGTGSSSTDSGYGTGGAPMPVTPVAASVPAQPSTPPTSPSPATPSTPAQPSTPDTWAPAAPSDPSVPSGDGSVVDTASAPDSMGHPGMGPGGPGMHHYWQGDGNGWRHPHPRPDAGCPEPSGATTEESSSH